VNFVDGLGFKRPDHVKTVTELTASSQRQIGVLAIPGELVHARADGGLEAFEFTVKYEVGYATQCVSTVSSRSTTGDHVHGTHQRGGEIVHVHQAAFIGRGYT